MAKAVQSESEQDYENRENPGMEGSEPGDDTSWDKPSELDDVPAGDYLVEVAERTDPTKWWMTSYEPDSQIPKYKSLGFQLEIIGHSEQEGRVIFHNTMYWASRKATTAIEAKTGRPFSPRGFTDSFLVALGAAKLERKGTKRYITIHPEFLDEQTGQLAPERFVGLRCKVKYGPDKSGEFMNVLKAWAVREQ